MHIVEVLKEERVCTFEIQNNEILITEACADYFDITLSKTQMIQLVAELNELIERLE